MMLLLCYKALWSLTCGGHITSSEVERLVTGSHAAAAVVGSTVPVAVLAVPVGVLPMHWIGCPWRLRAPDTVLVISLKMGESLLAEWRGMQRRLEPHLV